MRLIDADALRKSVLDLPNCYNGFSDAYDKSCIIGVIDEQPTIEERKKGKWMEFDSDNDRYDIIKCPCCKHTFTVDSYHWTDIGFVKDDLKFCPNCGADMRGGIYEID